MFPALSKLVTKYSMFNDHDECTRPAIILIALSNIPVTAIMNDEVSFYL